MSRILLNDMVLLYSSAYQKVFLISTAYQLKKAMLSFNLLSNPNDRYQLLTLCRQVVKNETQIYCFGIRQKPNVSTPIDSVVSSVK